MLSLWRALSNRFQRSEGGRGPWGARRLAHGNPDEQRNIPHRRWPSWLGIGAALFSPLLLGQCDPTSGATTGATALALTCTDGQLNGTETDVDCGGNACVPCSTAKACLVNGDCTSGVCTGNFCAAATCPDGVANGNEQGLDCGALGCPACPVTGCSPASVCSVAAVPKVKEDEGTSQFVYAHADRAVYWSDDQFAQFIGFARGPGTSTTPGTGGCELAGTGNCCFQWRLRRQDNGAVVSVKSNDDPSTTTKASAIVNLSTLDVGTYDMQFAVFPCGDVPNTDAVAQFTIVNKSRPPVTFPSEGIELNVQPEPLAANGIWAITTGLPLPDGMLAQTERLRLLEDGAIVPAQFTPLSRWLPHETGTLRWVGVDFVAKPGQAHNYRVVRVSSSAPAPTGLVQVLQNDNSLVKIKAGAQTFTISKTLFDGIHEAWSDDNGNGTLDTGEQQLNAGGGPFLVYSGVPPTVYRPGSACDSEQQNPEDKNPVVTVEAVGPVRATVRAEGCLVNSQGKTVARYVTWISVTVAGVRVDHQTIITKETTVKMAAGGIADGIADAGFDFVTVGGSGAAKAGVDGTAVSLSGGGSVHQYRAPTSSIKGVRCLNAAGEEFDCSATAKVADGWIATDVGAARSLLMTVKDFYQRFPQELEVSSAGGTRRLVLHQWPKHGLSLIDLKNRDSTFEALSRKEIHKAWFAHAGANLNFLLDGPGTSQVAAAFREELIKIDRPATWPAAVCVDTCEARQCSGGTAQQPCAAPGPAYVNDDNFACQDCAIDTAMTATGQGLALGNRIELAWLSPNATSSDLINRARLFQSDPHALPDPAWNGASGALGKLHPKDPARFPDIEAGIDRLYPGWHKFSVARGQLGKWVYADLHNAWNAQQDAPALLRVYQASHYHNTSDAWVNYFRSGDRGHLEWARANSDTLVNTHINHVRNSHQIGQLPNGYPAGGFDHTKGVTPWGADNAAINHPSDPEALLLRYYLTGDGWSRDAHRLWKGAVAEVFGAGGSVDRDAFSAVGGYLSGYQRDHDPQMIRYVQRTLDRIKAPPNPSQLLQAQPSDFPSWHKRWMEYERQQVRDPAIDAAILCYVGPLPPSQTCPGSTIRNLSPFAMAYDISCDSSGGCNAGYLQKAWLSSIYDSAHVYYENPADPAFHGMSLASAAPDMRFIGSAPSYLRALVQAGETVDPAAVDPTVSPGRYPFELFPACDHSVEIKLGYTCGSGQVTVDVHHSSAGNKYEVLSPAQALHAENNLSTTSNVTPVSLNWSCAPGEGPLVLFTFKCWGTCLIDAPISSTLPEVFVLRGPYNSVTKRYKYENRERFNFFVGATDPTKAVTLEFAARDDDLSRPAFVRAIRATTPPIIIKETSVYLGPLGSPPAGSPRSSDNVVLNPSTHPGPWRIYTHSPAGPYIQLPSLPGAPNAVYLSPTAEEFNAIKHLLGPRRLSVTGNLVAEFWADDGVSLGTNGKVAQWLNSGNGGNLTQAMPDKQPAYHSTDADFGAVNASVEFPGGNTGNPFLDGLQQAAAMLAGVDKPATLAVAVNRTTSAGWKTYFSFAATAPGAPLHMALRGWSDQQGSTPAYVLSKAGTGPGWITNQLFPVGTDTGTTNILVWRFDGTNSYLLQNGQQVLLPPFPPGAYSAPHQSGEMQVTRGILGARGDNNENASFKIAHLSVYKANVGAANAFRISNDINAMIGAYPVRLSVTDCLVAEFWADRGVSLGTNGKVAEWLNSRSGGSLTQATAALQPLYNSTDADFGAVNASVEFPGGNTGNPFLDGLQQAAAMLAGVDKPATLAVAVNRTTSAGWKTYFTFAATVPGAPAHMALRGWSDAQGSTPAYVLSKAGTGPGGITNQLFPVGTDTGTTNILVWRFDGTKSYLLQNGETVLLPPLPPGAPSAPHQSGDMQVTRGILGARGDNNENAAFKIAHLSVYKADVGDTKARTISREINAVIHAYQDQ